MWRSTVGSRAYYFLGGQQVACNAMMAAWSRDATDPVAGVEIMTLPFLAWRWRNPNRRSSFAMAWEPPQDLNQVRLRKVSKPRSRMAQGAAHSADHNGRSPVVKTLVALLDNAGRVVSKDELLESGWSGEVVDEANLSQNIYTLRRAFEAHGDVSFIERLSRRGYRFMADVSKSPLRSSPRKRPLRFFWLGAAAAVLVLCIPVATRLPPGRAAQKPADRQPSAAATQQHALGITGEV